MSEFLAKDVSADVSAERVALNDAMAVGWFYTRLGVEGDFPFGSAGEDGAVGSRQVDDIVGLPSKRRKSTVG